MSRSFTLKQGRSRVVFAGVCFIIFVASLSAQVTSVKLPTADNSASFQVQDNAGVVKLMQNGDGGFYLGGVLGAGVIPAQGAGSRLMWYPAKAAFRVGNVSNIQWDDANIGQYSTAVGFCTMASGTVSTAMGSYTTANGVFSTAIGYFTTASGRYSTTMGYRTVANDTASTAMGYYDTASGNYSTAMGQYTMASGSASTAMGLSTIASGNNSIAMGQSAKASGFASIAMGYWTMASGDYSTAMGFNCTASSSVSEAMGIYDTASGYASTAIGQNTKASGYASTAMGSYVSTNGHQGAFIIGDYSTTATSGSSADNEMTMRFAGGYRLYSAAAAPFGVTLAANGSSWATISDSTKKTNFQKADGDYFLSSLSKLKLGSWNYKSQDAKNYRHYGPMAQEIYRYFGHDGKGAIGCDTLLASADMDGIMMVCLQALEKKTTELNGALNELKTEHVKVSQLQSSVDEMKTEMMNMKSELRSLAVAKTGNTQEKIALNTSSKGK